MITWNQALIGLLCVPVALFLVGAVLGLYRAVSTDFRRMGEKGPLTQREANYLFDASVLWRNVLTLLGAAGLGLWWMDLVPLVVSGIWLLCVIGAMWGIHARCLRRMEASVDAGGSAADVTRYFFKRG